MKRWTSLLVALLAAALTGLFGQAELDCLPESGTPGTFVYDYAGLISPQDEAGLNAYIRALNDTTPNSIVVVTHPDLCGEDPFDFATGVGRKWGVGDAEFDNGVVLALSPKTRGTQRTGVHRCWLWPRGCDPRCHRQPHHRFGDGSRVPLGGRRRLRAGHTERCVRTRATGQRRI